MGSFEDLPTETRILILQHLSSIDLPSFLTSQHGWVGKTGGGERHASRSVVSRASNAAMPSIGGSPTDKGQTTQATCRSFRLLAQEILSHPAGVPGWSKSRDNRALRNPLLARDFTPLFCTAQGFTIAERKSVRWYLTLQGDVTLPFRRLPWVARGCKNGDGGDLREVYLRPGASWRDISVTLGRRPPITRLEIVKTYSSEEFNEDGRDHVQHLLVDLSTSGGFLTMGLLYDLVQCGGKVGDDSAATFGGETGTWDLLLCCRLRSYDLLVAYECFISDDDDLVDHSREAEGSAILYVQGGTVEVDDQDRRFEEPEDDDVGWVPQILGERPKIRLANIS